MPQVGNRRFPYTPEGRSAAKEYAERENTPPRNPYNEITRTIQSRRPPHQRQDARRQTSDPRSQDQWNAEFEKWHGVMNDAVSRLSPADQSNPERVQAAMRDLGRRLGTQQGRQRRPREGRWGNPGETRREHFDRDWDRDWDEDTSGRPWNPQSPEAGRR
jgi:hypothetical protein